MTQAYKTFHNVLRKQEGHTPTNTWIKETRHEDNSLAKKRATFTVERAKPISRVPTVGHGVAYALMMG